MTDVLIKERFGHRCAARTPYKNTMWRWEQWSGDASTSQETPSCQKLKKRDMNYSSAEPLEETNLARSLISDF